MVADFGNVIERDARVEVAEQIKLRLQQVAGVQVDEFAGLFLRIS